MYLQFLQDEYMHMSTIQATSKLLINYPEPQRSHILDYLFKVMEWFYVSG